MIQMKTSPVQESELSVSKQNQPKLDNITNNKIIEK